MTTPKRDLFEALVGAKWSLRQLQSSTAEVRDLQRVLTEGTAPADWERFAAFLTHWEVFIADELARFGRGHQ